MVVATMCVKYGLEFTEDLFGAPAGQGFAGAGVDLPLHPSQVRWRDRREVDSLGEVQAEQPVGVLVRAALPRAGRVAEVDFDAQGLADQVMLGDLHALNRPAGLMEGMNPREGGVMPAPRKYPQELRERAVRLVNEAMAEDPELSLNAAVLRIGPRVGVVPDTLRGWAKQVRVG